MVQVLHCRTGPCRLSPRMALCPNRQGFSVRAALFAVDQFGQLALGLGPIATLPKPQPKEAPTFLTERSLICVSRCHCEPRHDPARKPKCNTTTKCSKHTCNTPVGGSNCARSWPNKGHSNPRIALPRTNQWRCLTPRQATNACGGGHTCLITHKTLKEFTGVDNHVEQIIEAGRSVKQTEIITVGSRQRNRHKRHRTRLQRRCKAAPGWMYTTMKCRQS